MLRVGLFDVTVSSTIVAAGDGPEPLLTSSVPLSSDIRVRNELMWGKGVYFVAFFNHLFGWNGEKVSGLGEEARGDLRTICSLMVFPSRLMVRIFCQGRQ